MSTTLILGAGHAGSQCAVSLRAEGYEGDIVLINDDHETPYHKPPLSKKYLRSDEPEVTALRAASAYVKADVRWIHARAKAINVEEKCVTFNDRKMESFDNLVLATGARNRLLEDLNDCSNVFSLRTVQDAEHLHKAVLRAKSIAILGGGFIGLEVAACLAAMGKQVHVIEAADRLLGRVVAPSISQRVHDSLLKDGVSISTNSTSQFQKSNGVLTAVTLEDNTTIDVDVMLVGIGAIPNSEIAENAGLRCTNGIVVDAELQTSIENLFAIGDCASFPHWQTHSTLRLESVQNAVDQAKHVAKSIAKGIRSRYKSVPWFWSDIGDQKLQIAGIFTGESTTVTREEGSSFALYHLQNNRVVCVESLNSVKDHMLARKLIDAAVSVSEQDIADGPEALKGLLTK